MKSYLGRILICVVPVRAGHRGVRLAPTYARQVPPRRRSGRRHHPRLRGGHDARQQGDQVKPDELAAALKRRIDPADLYNVTIRPVAGDTPRVEIILPTGGQGQQAEEDAGLVEPAQRGRRQVSTCRRSKPNLYDERAVRQKQAAGPERHATRHKDAESARRSPTSSTVITRWPSGRRALTSEEVENIKNLIQQQGRLEFRILANPIDDKDAIEARRGLSQECRQSSAAGAYWKCWASRRRRRAPRTAADTFPVTLAGEDQRLRLSAGSSSARKSCTRCT